MSTEVLQIDSAQSTPRLSAHHLNILNLALSRAQLAEAQAVIARQEMVEARRQFEALRAQVGAEVGVALGQTHGWDAHTGEVRELAHG